MSEPGKPPDFSNLTENLSQQQAKISALKELVRQSESQQGKSTASVQEKVKNIAQRLSNLKTKAAKSKSHYRSSSEVSEDYGITNIEEEELQAVDVSIQASLHSSSSTPSLRAKSETPGSEKVILLRKQMELNRAKMAERESKSKEIEQMVTQLKSKFETSQMSLEKSVELGRSMGDLTVIPSMSFQSQHRSVSDVSHSLNTSFSLENEKIKFLEKRIRELEETLNSKENLTESEQVQRLEGKVLDLEENLKEKESLIEARTKAVTLLSENLTKKKKDVVDSLEDTKQEMFKMQETFLETESSYKNEVQRLNNIIQDASDNVQNLQEKCEILEKTRYELTIENSELKTKLEEVQDYSTKISELNKLNETLQKRIATLENQRYEFITEDEVSEAKTTEHEDQKSQTELLEKISALEKIVLERNESIEQLGESLQEKTIELNVLNANFNVLQEKYSSMGPKSLFPSDIPVDEDAQVEISRLKQQLDESNKNMIKTKLKIKQLQKQIDSMSKASDDSADATRLVAEIQNLTQRIAELEEEKGNYQLQLVGTETESDLEKKFKELETSCLNQKSAIQLLEEQKIDLSEDLRNTQQELEAIKDDNTLLERKVSELEIMIAEYSSTIKHLTEEKDEVQSKLSRYVNENMELLERIEKLSKGSSAESIEMVENLTAQEKFEMEQALGGQRDDDVPGEISQELNESLRNLREESSELMEKIELFTIERREVLEKLDALTIENNILVSSIETVKDEKLVLEHDNQELKQKIEEIEKVLSDLQMVEEELLSNVAELTQQRSRLQDEINQLVKNELATSALSSPVKTDDNAEEISTTENVSTIDREACEKLLKQLDNEIQNLHKNKDKHQKLKISKKLSDNAKNVHAAMTNLLVEYFKKFDESKQLREESEKVKILLNSITSSHKNDDEEIKQLQKKLNATVEALNEKNQEINALQEKFDNLQQSHDEALESEMETLKSEVKKLTNDAIEKDMNAVKLEETIELLKKERDQFEIEVQNQRSLASDLRKEFDQLCADVKVNNQRLHEKSAELDQLQHEFDMRLKTSTNEVEILKILSAEQKQLLIDSYQEHELDINQKVKEITEYQNQLQKLTDELESIKSQNAANRESYVRDLQAETEKLKALLEENNRTIDSYKDELLHKQETIDTLNNQIIDLYKSMEENSNKLIEKEDELQYLQEISESNRDEVRSLHQKLTDSNKTIEGLRHQLSDKNIEFERLTQKSAAIPLHDPHDVEKIRQLEQEVRMLDTKNKEQLEKLKKFAANLKKKQAQCTELEEKLAASGAAADPMIVHELQAKIIQYEEQLNVIKVESSKLNNSLQQSAFKDADDLKQKLDHYELTIQHQQKFIDNMESQQRCTSEKCDEMEEKCYELQRKMHQLEEEKVNLLESNKSLEILSAQFATAQKERDELAEKLKQYEESKNTAAGDDKKKMDKLKSAVVQLKHKLAEKKKEVDEMTVELEKFKLSAAESSSNEVESMRSQMLELQEMNGKILSETKTAYEHDIGILKQQIDDLEATNRILNEDKQRKVSLEGQLETYEMECVALKDRLLRMEEAISKLESERNSLVREKLEMEADIAEKDEIIGTKLRETEADNFHMIGTIKELTTQRDSLNQKLSSLEAHRSDEIQKNAKQVQALENENNRLQQEIQQLHIDMKKAHVTFEQTLTAKHAEIDEMESELSSQLQRIESEKKTVQEALEKAKDQIIDFQDEVVRLKDNAESLELARADLEREMSWLKLQNENYTQDQLENEQLRMQLMQSETEIENLRTQNDAIIQNHAAETIILSQQITDLEAMRSQVSQNQTDDQVMLQNENIKLKEMLAEKQTEIQQKSIQLQMTSVFSPVQAANDPFAELSTPSQSQSDENVKSLEEKLRNTEIELERIREANVLSSMELDVQGNKIQELLHENKTTRSKIDELEQMKNDLINSNMKMEERIENLMGENSIKDCEINEIRNEMEILRSGIKPTTDDDKLHLLESELIEKNRAIENLQSILEKYKTHKMPTIISPAEQLPTVPVALSTSMFFENDPAQSSAASLFDDPFSYSGQQPVEEELIVPKKSYICYGSTVSSETQTENDWLVLQQAAFNTKINQLQDQVQLWEQRFAEQSAELELQYVNISGYMNRIIELEAINQPTLPANIAQYFDASIQQQPVFQSVEQSESMAALEIEDGWGWGSENASEPQQQQIHAPLSLLSPRSDLEVRLQEQRDIVERLEQEKNVLSDELINLRDNSKKMMKKLKEYQTKMKELETRALRKSSSAESNDLDLAIQEELNSQVLKLETKLREVNAEREKEQQEKEMLTKKVDVLMSASDRMTEMKERQDSQMEMYQLKIRDMSQKLKQLQEWGNEDVKKEEPSPDQSPMKENQSELYKKIEELSERIRDMQVDYDEIQALLDEEKSNNTILEERISKLQDTSQQEESASIEEVEKLSRLLRESSSQREMLSHQIISKDQEIQELISKIDLLSNESTNIKTILDDLSSQIREKTNENQELHDRLQKFATNNDELSRERKLYSDSVEQDYRQQVNEFELQLQSLHAELQYKSTQLNEKTSEATSESERAQLLADEANVKNQEILTLKNRILELEAQTPALVTSTSDEDMHKRLTELERLNSELSQEKAHMEHELQVLNDQVLSSLEFEDRMKETIMDLDAKNIEVQMLKASLERLQQHEEDILNRPHKPTPDVQAEVDRLLAENEALELEAKTSIDLLNAQWSQMVEQRGNEVANSWKHHLEMREIEFAKLESELRSQLQQNSSSQTPSGSDGADNDTMNKMKSIMESQEVEIVSLKEQLAIRSAEYAALSAKVDPYHQMTTSISTVPQSDSDRVPRSELDLALYLLHQREMRVEEMTMEVVRLLEERDTLQLRLSNVIRQYEETKRNFNIVAEPESSDISKTTTPEKAMPSASVPSVEDEQLQAKLTELTSVRHLHDKAFQDDREQRFQQNMSMIQRDVANLPSAAAARIVGSTSQDNTQSPSSVLMNWIMGNKPDEA